MRLALGELPYSTDVSAAQFKIAECYLDCSEESLVRLLQPLSPPRSILASYSTDPALAQKIEALRGSGQVVVVELPGQEVHRAEAGCAQRLLLKNGVWEIE